MAACLARPCAEHLCTRKNAWHSTAAVTVGTVNFGDCLSYLSGGCWGPHLLIWLGRSRLVSRLGGKPPNYIFLPSQYMLWGTTFIMFHVSKTHPRWCNFRPDSWIHDFCALFFQGRHIWQVFFSWVRVSIHGAKYLYVFMVTFWKAPLGFEPRIPCLLDRLFNQLSQGTKDAIWVSLVVQLVKNPSTVQKTWVRSLGWEDLREKGKATHSSILA